MFGLRGYYWNIKSFFLVLLRFMWLILDEFRSSHQRCSQKSCSQKFCNIHWKTPVLASLFNKKRLQHRCFSINIAKFLRTPTLKNICEQLLLWVAIIYLKKQHFIFLWLFVRFAWLLSMNKKQCYSLLLTTMSSRQNY